MAASGGVIRNANAYFWGAFAESVGQQTTLFFNIFEALRAIDLVHHLEVHNLCFDMDSTLVVMAFKNKVITS